MLNITKSYDCLFDISFFFKYATYSKLCCSICFGRIIVVNILIIFNSVSSLSFLFKYIAYYKLCCSIKLR